MPDLFICRACLACDVPVYNILRTRYQDGFEKITSILVGEDSKPHALCAPCLETLDKSCRLREKAAVSEGLLTSLLHQDQLTEAAIRSIDRQQHRLADILPAFTLAPMTKARDTDNIMIKIEPVESDTQDDQNFPDQTTSVFAKGPPNREISIETVKVKETRYIQIEPGTLLAGVKTEINASGALDDESLLQSDNEIEQSDYTECNNLLEYKYSVEKQIQEMYTSEGGNVVKKTKPETKKNAQAYSKKKCNVDNRRLKTISCGKCEFSCDHKRIIKPCEEHKEDNFCCSECKYKTCSRKNLIYHMKRHTNTGMVVCAICGYKCATKSRLVSHIRIHTKEKPYQCNVCQKRFSEIGSLGKHLKHLHRGVKAFKCMWCEYQAASKSHLERHIQRHTGDKRFKCELCDYACVQKWDLKRHAKTHESVRVIRYKRVAPVIVQVKTCEDE